MVSTLSVAVQAQGKCQAFKQRRNSILADPGLPDIFKTSQTVITTCCYQADDLVPMTLIVMNCNSAKILSWPISQGMAQMHSLSQTETDITSDSNIIPYSQYLSETQQETVQNSNSSAQQDVLILSSCQRRTTATAITEGSVGFEQTKLVFEMKSIRCEQQRLDPELLKLQESSFRVKMNDSWQQAIDKGYCKDCCGISQSQAKDTVIVKLKEKIKSLKGNVDESTVKMDMDEIETLNIELEHRVTKLVAENEHLENETYNNEQGLVIAALKNELRKLKGKALDNKDTVTHSVDPKVSKDNMEPITPKLLNKRTAHSSYIKHTQEEALVPSGSLPSGNTKNDRILQTPSSNSKNKVEAHPRNIKSSLNKRMKSKKHKSKKVYSGPTGKVFTQIGYIWRPTGRTFTIVGNACPLTRITPTNEVPSRKPIVLDSESPKPVVKLEPSKSWGSTKTNIPSTSLNECRHETCNEVSLTQFERITNCSACAYKISKKPHKPNPEATNQEKLYLMHMDLVGQCVLKFNERKYILVIVDDNSRFTWVKCLRSKMKLQLLLSAFEDDTKYRLKGNDCPPNR
ncbi:retrovirus-related pol polyprotein from transposon TNT 1-94 [Tanacetum coccineum]|uniref:Retrovirus-related pol polyprotein from transposon TNT 1-94 n=1 Tax=Tanacetum coccineum TaxID=301880 RepID=A0ABQ4XFS9_9ASTR